jgi:hypothetical protein
MQEVITPTHQNIQFDISEYCSIYPAKWQLLPLGGARESTIFIWCGELKLLATLVLHWCAATLSDNDFKRWIHAHELAL